jgi:dTDP-glucose pyrophosphorylase
MDINGYIVRPHDSIKDVVEVIIGNKDGIALVVDEKGGLVATITDGDIRRFMLTGADLTAPCSRVMNEKPVVAHEAVSREELIQTIKQHRIRNIPIVNSQGMPVAVINSNDLIGETQSDTVAVVMAGGEGRRLRPLTEQIPKPMLPIGDRPLLEQIIRNLKTAEIDNIYISVNYRADIIEDHFQDGTSLGVKIHYLREEKRLGTAGALSQFPLTPSGPVLVTNGDVVTNVNFSRLLEFHREHRAVMSLAAMDYRLNIPYGVLDLAGHYVLGLDEKPTKHFLCNAGIYVLDPDIITLVPKETYYDMTDLLCDVTRRGLPVAAFPIHEYWVDIGDKSDLKKAQTDCQNGNYKEGADG